MVCQNFETEEKDAVKAGYWHLFRFDPRLKAQGKNPFQLDSKAPTESYTDFLKREVRYTSLMRSNPERAEKLFAEAELQAAQKYAQLQKMVELYAIDEEEK